MSGFRSWLMQVATTTTQEFRASYVTPEQNHCIEWARVQQLALEALGVRSRAVPVEVMAGNEAAAAQLFDNSPMTPALEAKGAWTVGVTHQVQGSGWPGHLVLAVSVPDGGGRVLLDGTAGQFSRPAKGMSVPDGLMLTLPSLWVEPVYARPQTGIIRYSPMPPQVDAARTWRESPAWTNPVLPELAAAIADQCTPWLDVAHGIA